MRLRNVKNAKTIVENSEYVIKDEQKYIGSFKKGYKQCKRCGKIIKNTGNKKTYCNKCATDNELMSKKKWWNNH